MTKKRRRERGEQPARAAAPVPDAPAQTPLAADARGLDPWLIAAIVVSLAAAVIRFWDLDGKSLWFDEMLSVADSVSTSLRFGSGFHPPLFYYALHAVMALFGTSDTVLRLVAAIPGTLTIPVVYLVGRRLASPRAGVFSAAVLAVSSLHVEYSQEVRMYALATFFLACATLAASHLVAESERSNRRTWLLCVGYTIGAYLAMSTHYLTIFVLAAEALALIVAWRWTRPVVLRLVALQLPAILGAVVAIAGLGYWRRIGVAADFLANRGGVNQSIFQDLGTRTLHFPVDLLLSILPGLNLKWLALASYRLPAFIVFDVIVVLAAVALARHRSVPAPARIFLLVAAFAPLPVIALMLGPEQLRFYLVTVPFVALVIGAGLDAIPWQSVSAGALAITLIASSLATWWYFDPGMDKQPWRRVAAIVEEQARDGDIVLINEPHLQIAFDRYYVRKPGVEVEGYPEVGGIQISEENLDRWFLPLVRDRKRVWFVRMGATASHSDPKGLALKWLDTNMHLVSRLREPGYNGDIEVIVFER